MTSAIQPPRLRSFSSLGGTRWAHQAPHNLCSPLIISRAGHSRATTQSTRRLGRHCAGSPARRCRCEAGSRRGPERDDGRGLATGGQSSEKGEPADDSSLCGPVGFGSVSHSAVAFPVDAYLGRIQRMVDELARLRLAHLNPE
eukprot:CAMPEP_0177770630 /NCGR_PEP_ID=MMETSP0491_2-20121128/11056_1 /TAXON_ID=63592 /ORGANISM="Tetraselmis chuii, Strain PLY429" /LENGTH=142 /DNA_ID=CAMNT_0019287915 /DNA_START=103 /DNA_END=531 /DNA_ORIENTATION=+